jgi:hypothetical protein
LPVPAQEAHVRRDRVHERRIRPYGNPNSAAVRWTIGAIAG